MYTLAKFFYKRSSCKVDSSEWSINIGLFRSTQPMNGRLSPYPIRSLRTLGSPLIEPILFAKY
jgi:hypothetical protein